MQNVNKTSAVAPPEVREESDVIIDNILTRCSVRSYSDSVVASSTIEKILKAGMAAPTARNLQPWKLVVVENRACLDSMASGLPYAKMLLEAPLAIVVYGDTVASNSWVQDCSAVTENILLAAHALGLGAVWTAAFPYDDRIAVVQNNIPLSNEWVPLCVIPMGYPKGETKIKEKWDPNKVLYVK